MKLFKRSICLAIVALMLLATVVACSPAGNNPTGSQGSGDVAGDNGAGDATNPDGTDDVIEIETDEYGQPIYDDPTVGLKFDGQTINILIRSGAQYAREWYSEEPASNIDHKVYSRNQAVQEALGVKLKYIEQDEGANCEDFIAKVVNTGTAAMGGIDVVSSFAAWGTTQAAMSFYLNWLDEEKLPHLNLDRVYWNQNYIKAAQSFDKLYVNVGDMNLSVYDRCMVIYFNKTLVEDFVKDVNGDPVNLYELVNSGEWYYEDFYELTKGMYEDTNNNGAADDKDFYGVTGIIGSEAPDAFLYSLGGALTTTADDGTHALVTGTDYDRLAKVFDKMIEFWYSEDAFMPDNSYKNCDMFAGGYTLFTVDTVYHHNEGFTKFQEMEDGFGIIPMPKLDEDQETYITGVQDAHNLLSILDCGGNQDFEMISAVLEKMAHYSYGNVRPYYVETVLMKQNMDFNSAKCFNYVINGIRWDFADVYTTSLSKLRESQWRTPFKTNTSFTQRWQVYNQKFTQELSNLDTWLISQK